MKITAGLGSLLDFETLASAMPDEIFVGYVPYEWNINNDEKLALNRREVFFCHVQIGCLEDMKILYSLSRQKKIDIAVTFNSLYYSPDKLEQIAGIIGELSRIGYENFIVADVNLIRYLSENKVDCNLHISGEVGMMNSYTIRFLMKQFNNDTTRIKRIIFPRRTSIEGMKSCMVLAKNWGYELEFEAFFMNEICKYSGGFCNSLHCDEMEHMCRLERVRVPLHTAGTVPAAGTVPDDAMGTVPDGEVCDAIGMVSGDETCESRYEWDSRYDERYIPGMTGCGLCALKELKEAGIDVLKIVGRGESADCMKIDISATRTALSIVDSMDYISKMKSLLFPKGCSKNCYY